MRQLRLLPLRCVPLLTSYSRINVKVGGVNV